MSGGVYLVSAEPSGDRLNLGLIRELETRTENLSIHAIGGATLQEAGFESAVDTSPLSVVGFVEGLKVLPTATRLAAETAGHILRARPDLVILTDSWGFNIRVAQFLKASAPPFHIMKYVAPQVWAMRRGRARVLAAAVDSLMCLYPFDVPFFEAAELPTTCVGNPVLDVDWGAGDGPAFRRRHNISMLDPVLFVAFGSRRAEIDRLTEPFLQVIAALKAKRPGLAVVAPTVPETEGRLKSRLATMGGVALDIITVSGETRDALAASDIGLLKSGTVTTQAADAGVPSIVAYKVSPATYWPAKFLFKADFVSIVNVYAGVPLLPEYIQGDVDPEAMAAQLDRWLSDPKEARARSESLRAVTDGMRGEGGANARAAECVLQTLGLKPGG